MKTLIILRHAKSSWDDSSLTDYERPLNDRGLRDAPRIGTEIAEHGKCPDLILSSTARRAIETARLVSIACGFKGELIEIPSFYQSDVSTLLQRLNKLEDAIQSVMIVGHNPEMEELLSRLTAVPTHLTTANFAELQLPIDHWAELSAETRGELITLWRPKELV